MGGTLLALNAVASHRRAKAMESAAKAQAEGMSAQAEANKQTEHGRRQERFKNAIEHLGAMSAAIRMGGRYELYNLAKETPELRQTVLDIFCTHIRQVTSEEAYRERHATKPSLEIQDLLSLAFVRDPDVFSGCRIELSESWLNGADLREARLWKANLRSVRLFNGLLDRARMQGASLVAADLRGAQLSYASLHGANLFQVRMEACNLLHAQLQGSMIAGGHLTGANLGGARFVRCQHVRGAPRQYGYAGGRSCVLVCSGGDLSGYGSERRKGHRLVSLSGIRRSHQRNGRCRR